MQNEKEDDTKKTRQQKSSPGETFLKKEFRVVKSNIIVQDTIKERIPEIEKY